MKLDQNILRRIVSQALEEDLGSGDVTCKSVLPARAAARSFIVSRSPGVVAGMPVAEEVFRQVSADVHFSALLADGDALAPGTRMAEVSGPMAAVLSGERVALNFLQRLCGIATITRRCVDAVKGTGVRILDTRKTTPGLRHLEKYAVRVGGGVNHRIGLYDQVLIKDNHLRTLLPETGDLPGAVRLSVQRAREHVGTGMKIEVETESLDMVRAAIEADADIIMLDNMSLDEMAQAAQLVRHAREKHGGKRPITEASGGITPERLAQVAATGVDTISLGLLTHSAPVLDLAMDTE